MEIQNNDNNEPDREQSTFEGSENLWEFSEREIRFLVFERKILVVTIVLKSLHLN